MCNWPNFSVRENTATCLFRDFQGFIPNKIPIQSWGDGRFTNCNFSVVTSSPTHAVAMKQPIQRREPDEGTLLFTHCVVQTNNLHACTRIWRRLKVHAVTSPAGNFNTIVFLSSLLFGFTALRPVFFKQCCKAGNVFAFNYTFTNLWWLPCVYLYSFHAPVERN